MTTHSVGPYVGPRPFQRIDEALFFGREKEASELLSLIIANPLLLLYARSGAGKTSLINARLTLLLEREEIEVLPVARVQGHGREGINLSETPGANIYTFNALSSWKRGGDHASALVKMTLAEFLSRERRPAREDGQTNPRVIVFDQFEELFTFYPDRWMDRLEFFRQVSELLEGSPLLLRACDLQNPAGLIEDFAKGRDAMSGVLVKRLSPEAQGLIRNGNGDAGAPAAIKLLVDDINRVIQGESLFDEGAFAGAELRSETRELVRRRAGGREALRLNRLLLEDAYPRRIRRRTEGDPLLRVVFSMREDYIAELDPYASVLPNKLRARYRLEPLRERAALSAVKGPIEKTDLRFAPGVAEHLVENLLKIQVKTAGGVTEIPGEFVEPVQLQVVCQSLWVKVHEAGEKEITEAHLRTHGNVGKALREFYETTIRLDGIQKMMLAKGVSEWFLREWFEEELITKAGTRGMVFRDSETTCGLSNDIVDELENQHIIRAELRGGERWYELSHDRFIHPIRESNNEWRLTWSGAISKRQELEAKAAEWVRAGRGEVGLLDESAAIEAKRWLQSDEAKQVDPSPDLFAFVQSSRLAVSKAERERERAAFQRENEQAKALAEEQRLRAEEQERRAEAERTRAEEKVKSSARLRKLVAALGVLALVAVGMTVYAFMQRATAVAELEENKRLTQKNNDLQLVASLKEEALRLERNSDFDQALERNRNALEIYNRYQDKAGQVSTLESIGRLHISKRNYADSVNSYSKALDLIDPQDRTINARILTSRGHALQGLKDYDEAESDFQKALKLSEEASDYDGQFDALYGIGRARRDQGDYKEAAAAFERMKALAEEKKDPNDLAFVYLTFGELGYAMKDHERAVYNYQKALEIYSKNLKDTDRTKEVQKMLDTARADFRREQKVEIPNKKSRPPSPKKPPRKPGKSKK